MKRARSPSNTMRLRHSRRPGNGASYDLEATPSQVPLDHTPNRHTTPPFEGDWQKEQRPSWNYKKGEDGSIILDMFCHWRRSGNAGEERHVDTVVIDYVNERGGQMGLIRPGADEPRSGMPRLGPTSWSQG